MTSVYKYGTVEILFGNKDQRCRSTYSGSSVEVAWVLRGFCEELNPFFCLNVNAKDI